MSTSQKKEEFLRVMAEYWPPKDAHVLIPGAVSVLYDMSKGNETCR